MKERVQQLNEQLRDLTVKVSNCHAELKKIRLECKHVYDKATPRLASCCGHWSAYWYCEECGERISGPSGTPDDKIPSFAEGDW